MPTVLSLAQRQTTGSPSPTTDLGEKKKRKRGRIYYSMTGTTLATSSYDSHDNRISVTDARSHVTASSFDDLGRVRSVTSPDTGTTSATYDQAGNLLTLTDAKGQTITATYDALNRPLTQSYPGAAREIVSTYDQPFKGRLSAIQVEESNRSFAVK